MNPADNNLKRGFDEAFQHQDAPPDKRQKTAGCSFLVLPKEIQDTILSYLDYKDLLAFERASRGCRNLTDYSWTQLREQYNYTSNFRACEKDPHSNKWNFLLWAALIKYMTIELFAKERQTNPLKWAYEVGQRYQGIMDRFTCLGAYIRPKLYEILTVTPPSPAYFQDQRAAILEGALAGYGGDLTLQGLFECSSSLHNDVSRIENIRYYLTKAIEKNANEAFLLYSVSGSVSNRNDYTRFSYLLSLELEQLVWEKGGKGSRTLAHHNQLISSGRMFYNSERVRAEWRSGFPAGQTPSPKERIYQAIMKFRIFQQEHETEIIFDQAISSYGESAPDFALYYSGCAKMKNPRLKEADALFTHVVNPPDKKLPPFVLESASDVKFALGDLPEGERLYERTIKAYGGNVPAQILDKAGQVKLRLSKWAEADELFTRAIKGYGDNVPAYLLEVAASVKSEIEKASVRVK